MAGARKRPNPGGKFQAWFVDAAGKRQFFTGTHDRRETLAMARKLEDEHKQVRLGYREPPRSASKHAARLYSEAVGEYVSWGLSCGGRGGRGWAKIHARQKQKNLEWWAEHLGLASLGDLPGILPRAEAALRELQGRGLSGKSIMDRVESIKSFCRWAERRGFLDHDPTKGLTRFDTTPTRIYRALTREELAKLLAAVPEERQLIYTLAVATGLRRSELKTLKVSDLNLDMQALNLRAEITKNKKSGLQPLSPWLLDWLLAATQGSDPDAPLLAGFPGNPTETFYKDLKAAGIPRFVVGEGSATLHSLRVTFATLLIEEGADIKTAQTLMRHSTPTLTLNRYAKARRERLVDAAAKVGEIAREAVESGEFCATSVLPKTAFAVSGYPVRGILEGDTGFEPATPGSGGRCSIH